ncbi:ATP-dependent DNA helicase [Trichonephila clavipes]|nr:ATP-dependent DNA helicase [Trichonephila clavipes]
MFDPSSFANPAPVGHADASRDVLPRGGRFTTSQTKEAAVVIVGQEFEKRDIVLSCRSGTLMRINETHRAYDALQYPLMFFRGEDGYQINIPKRHETTKIPLSKTVSASEFYSYRIMERYGEGTEDQDEVTRYDSGRYISNSEAVWRILCFPIHERFPPVIHLSVHLENGQRVYFTEDNTIHKILNPQKTTLMAFFELCQGDNFAKTLLYCEVTAYYVWKNSKFYRRKKGKAFSGYPEIKKDQVLGRVYIVHPGNTERYYLRLLLHKIPGPTSFTALKIVTGVVQPSFQTAC